MSELNNIPKHWQVKKLSEIGKSVTGTTPPKNDTTNYGNDIPFVKPPQLFDSVISNAPEKLSTKGASLARILPVNSVLITCIGNLGRTAINKIPVAFNQQINAVIPSNDIDGKFLFYQAQSHSFKSQLDELSSATTVAIVNKGKFETIRIVLPPLSEQLAIVSKIEELLSDLENGKQQLLTAQQQLKVYRQSLLKAAFEGKLTSTSLSELKDGELPEGWKVIELKDLVEKISDGPFGSNLKSIDYVDKGVRVIRLENIGEMEFRDEYKTFVTPEKYETIKNHTVGKGDIIFSSFIIESIRSVILPDYIERAINKADCFLVRVSEKKINKKYLAYYFSTKAMRNQLVSQIHGATRPRINTTQLKLALIPAPNLVEQQLIVEILESKLTVCDKIAETISQSLLQAETLKQSILKKAFEGKF